MKQKKNDVERLLEDLTNFFVHNMEIKFREAQLRAFLVEQYGFEARHINPRVEYLKGVGLIKSVAEKNGILELNVEMLLLKVPKESEFLIRSILKEIDEFDAKERLDAIKEAEKEASA